MSLRFDGWDLADPSAMCRTIDEIVTAVAEHNAEWLSKHENAPGLYQSGVFYRVQRTDVFQDIPAVMADGHSDCKNLVAWRLAELALLGAPARSLTFWQYRPEKGAAFPYWFHVVVLRQSGEIEDPSAALGMTLEG
jgi:hypothetical protein